MSSKRMSRYLNACGGDKRKAQSLYRLNLRLSQEMFTVISCYEVALRNAIDRIMTASFGSDWLRDAILPGGFFDNPHFSGTAHIMHKAYNELIANGKYSCSKMLSARLRNRIAHHEPVCFLHDQETISTAYLQNCYSRILRLFSWMDIDSKSLLYGLDHVLSLSQRIDLIVV